jgi:hypothetical protein
MKILAMLFLTLLISCNNEIPNKSTSKSSVDKNSIDSSTIVNLLSDECNYENNVNSLGIGLIKAPLEFVLYNDSLLSSIYATINIEAEENSINFCPKFYKPDYGILQFVCLEKTSTFFKILINNSEIKFLELSKEYDFVSWKDYILTSYGIRRKETYLNLPLFAKSNENAQVITIPDGYELFCPLEVDGDWVKVKYDCFYNDKNNSFEGETCHQYIDKCKNSVIGWLKWKNENDLLIEIFLIP